MIITLKDKDSIWVAVNGGTGIPNIHIEDKIHEDNLNMWRVQGVENAVMASIHTGGIDLDRLRYSKLSGLSGNLTLNNLVLKTVPDLRALFEDCNMMDGNESWHTLLVAKGDKAFVISPEFTCCEVEDFATRGNGDDVAYGAMAYYKDLPAIERITAAFKALEKTRNNKQFPIVIMNTVSKDRIVIYK